MRGVDGLVVVFREQQDDLQLRGRIVDRAEVGDQVGHRVGVVEKRNHHGVRRQVALVECRRHRPPGPRTTQADREREPGIEQIARAGQQHERGDRRPSRENQGQHRHRDDQPGPVEPTRGGERRRWRRAIGPLDGLVEVPVGGHADADRHADRRLDHRHPFRRGLLGGGHQHVALVVVVQRQPGVAEQHRRVVPRQVGVEPLGADVEIAAVPGGRQGPEQVAPRQHAVGHQHRTKRCTTTVG
ncbi:hypothetical protein DFJ67_7774 [Asanoa ferruginea]|uniref:Uncharacterized protein n=1 Tax=Asanoa ferruginea TaxID=53367 RepID=A0A3D9ZWU1_9ACTN|nr:hypothetical protein DFJ67_7774 [Asanoa ferruginea]